MAQPRGGRVCWASVGTVIRVAEKDPKDCKDGKDTKDTSAAFGAPWIKEGQRERPRFRSLWYVICQRARGVLPRECSGSRSRRLLGGRSPAVPGIPCLLDRERPRAGKALDRRQLCG